MARMWSAPGGIAWAAVAALTAVMAPQAGAWQGSGPIGGKVGAAPIAGGGVARASCVVMLRGGPGADRQNGASDLGTIAAALTSTELVDPAAKSALGLGPDQWPTVAQVELTPAGDRSLKIIVTVAPGEKGEARDEAARKLLREMVTRGEGVVARMGSPRRAELQARVKDLGKLLEELKAGAVQLRVRRDDAQAKAAAGGGAAQAFNQPSPRLQLESQLARSKPRLEAIKAVLAKSEGQLGEADAAARELVAAREAVATALAEAVEKGEAGRLDLLRARADVADAKARRVEAERGPIPSPSLRYRDEVTSLDVEVRVLEAQLAALPPEPARPATPANVGDPQRLQIELSRVENELRTAENESSQARRELESLGEPPSLVVLDGKEAGR